MTEPTDKLCPAPADRVVDELEELFHSATELVGEIRPALAVGDPCSERLQRLAVLVDRALEIATRHEANGSSERVRRVADDLIRALADTQGHGRHWIQRQLAEGLRELAHWQRMRRAYLPHDPDSS